MTDSLDNLCTSSLPPQAAEGIRLFNAGKYFEAHEALEDAWNEEKGLVRELYRGILQIAVVYFHITRKNYPGAVKVYDRSQKWLKDWPAICQGVNVGKLRQDAEAIIDEIKRLGPERIAEFNLSLFQPIQWEASPRKQERVYICDLCGHEMVERNCKVTCPNCGNRFDCSDLNIYLD